MNINGSLREARQKECSNMINYIFWKITHRCNQRCRVCHLYGEHNHTKLHKELSYEQNIGIIDKLYDYLAAGCRGSNFPAASLSLRDKKQRFLHPVKLGKTPILWDFSLSAFLSVSL